MDLRDMMEALCMLYSLDVSMHFYYLFEQHILLNDTLYTNFVTMCNYQLTITNNL